LFNTQSCVNNQCLARVEKKDQLAWWKQNPLTMVRSKAFQVGTLFLAMMTTLFPQKAFATSFLSTQIFGQVESKKYSLVAAVVKSSARKAAISRSKTAAVKSSILPILPTSSTMTMPMPTMPFEKLQKIGVAMIVLSLVMMFVWPTILAKFQQMFNFEGLGKAITTKDNKEDDNVAKFEKQRLEMLGKVARTPNPSSNPNPTSPIYNRNNPVIPKTTSIPTASTPSTATDVNVNSNNDKESKDTFKYTPITIGKTFPTVEEDLPDVPDTPTTPSSLSTTFNTYIKPSGKKEIHPRVAEILNRKKLQTLTGISEGGAVTNTEPVTTPAVPVTSSTEENIEDAIVVENEGIDDAEEVVTAAVEEEEEEVKEVQEVEQVAVEAVQEEIETSTNDTVVEPDEAATTPIVVQQDNVVSREEVPSFATIMIAPEESKLPVVAVATSESIETHESTPTEEEPLAQALSQEDETNNAAKADKEEDDEEDNESEEVVDNSSMEPTMITTDSSAFVATSLPSDSASSDGQKPGLLGRFFGKPAPTSTASETRPNSLDVAFPIGAKDLDLRVAIFTILQRYLTTETKAAFDAYFTEYGVPSSKKPYGLESWKKKFSWKLWAKLSLSEVAIGMKKMLESVELSLTEGSVVFAAIVNMVIVQSVDLLIQLDTKKQTEYDALTSAEEKKTFQSQHDTEMIKHLDGLYEAMNHMGSVFVTVFPGCGITPPIQYNGLQTKDKLEQVLMKYLKASIMGNGMFGTPEPTGSTDTTNTPVIKAEERELRAGRLQYLLGISESRKNQLEQKLMKDLMFSGMGMPAGPNNSAGNGAEDELLAKLMGGAQAEAPKKGGLGGLVGGIGKGIVGGIASGIGNALTGGKFSGNQGNNNPFAALSNGGAGMPDMKELEEMMKSDPKGLQEKLKSTLGDVDPNEMLDMSMQALGTVCYVIFSLLLFVSNANRCLLL